MIIPPGNPTPQQTHDLFVAGIVNLGIPGADADYAGRVFDKLAADADLSVFLAICYGQARRNLIWQALASLAAGNAEVLLTTIHAGDAGELVIDAATCTGGGDYKVVGVAGETLLISNGGPSIAVHWSKVGGIFDGIDPA